MDSPLQKRVLGRPQGVSIKTWNYIMLEVIRNSWLTAYELKDCHPKLLQKASIRTVQRALQKKLKMPLRRAAMKPLITHKCEKNACFCQKVLELDR